jgi:flagellar biosynthesis/type III secretory pathway protein FliH
VQRGETLTSAEWWYYMIENSEKFTENEIQKYQNVGMPEEITEALDKLKFSGWNRNDQQVYEGEVQEVITYHEELERREQEGLLQGIQKGLQRGLQEGIQQGLQEGIQQGLQWGQIKGLIERFLDHESLEKSLRRIEQNSIPKNLVEQVWRDFIQNQPVPDGENLEDFVQILQNAGILQ